jgi:ABC-type Fe3+ transport system permease subunit
LSLLGSTLGKSTAASAGIGLLLCVALMLAGSLPLYGALLPGGLLGWATQLGMTAAGVAPVAAQEAIPAALQTATNGGAAASALVIIVLALVLAIGIFEQQEL